MFLFKTHFYYVLLHQNRRPPNIRCWPVFFLKQAACSCYATKPTSSLLFSLLSSSLTYTVSCLRSILSCALSFINHLFQGSRCEVHLGLGLGHGRELHLLHTHSGHHSSGVWTWAHPFLPAAKRIDLNAILPQMVTISLQAVSKPMLSSDPR
jgi:hypothetical protein